MKSVVTLNGTWQLLPVDRFRQGFYPLPDEVWANQDLPGQWQQHPLFAHYIGRMVYRRRFTATPANAGSRSWLRLNGCFYWSQPYLDGVDLGRHAGYFVAQECEVTNWLAAENELVIEVECADEPDKLNKRQITGVFSHWDALDQALNPGGIWLPIELIQTGPARLHSVRLQTVAADDERALLSYELDVDSAAAGSALVRWQFAPLNFTGVVQTIDEPVALRAGRQALRGGLTLRDPQRWWTHDLGAPNCYQVTAELIIDQQPSDTQQFSFGVRTFELRDWVPHLNGVRFFAKGSNYGPSDASMARMTAADFARDLRLATDAHMNMLRVHAHVEHPAFYEAADQAGVLLWQDFPLQWRYERAILPEAAAQAVAMVRLLTNHPSVAIWCMHNESLHLADTHDTRFFSLAKTVASAVLWNWNRSVMDRRLKQLVEREDDTRPVVRSSGEFAISPLHSGTDTHFYHGWYYLTLHSFDRLAQQFPRNIRFITEFGAQSFPNLESSRKFLPDDARAIDWRKLAARNVAQPRILARWINWRGATNLAELVELTQAYQIKVNRYFIDRLRFYKYRPTGGVLPFMLHDPHPAVSWSVVDYWRVPKQSYAALQLAFSPQYFFALLEREVYRRGEQVDLPLYTVNDAHLPMPVVLAAELRGPTGAVLVQTERELTLPPDGPTVEVERLRLLAETTGTYTLRLMLRPSAGAEQVQEYQFTVVRG